MAKPKKQKINIGPQPGPQTKFLQSTADIGIYGGSAGAGKSMALLLEPVYHLNVRGFGCVAFRRTTPQLRGEGSLWDTSCQIYPYLDGQPREADLEWIFPPHKIRVKFSHIEHDRNRFDWDSTQIPLILFDQVESFSEVMFWHMLGRNRSTCGVKPYIRASANPVASGWLHDLVCSYWVGEDGFPIPERSGVLRWMVRLGDEMFWGDTREDVILEVHERYGIPIEQILPLSVTFVPGLPTDNKILMEADPSYLAKLHALPRVERERLLGGNWNVTAGAGDFFQREWCGEPLERPPEDAKARVRSWDLASTKPSEAARDPDWSVGVLMSRAGKMTVIEHAVRRRDSPGAIKDFIKRTAEQDRELYGRQVKIRLAQDPGQAGKAQAADLVESLDGFTVIVSRETGDKETRAGPFSSAAEHGLVKYVRGPWNDVLLNELEMFPRGKHDDDMDAVASAFLALSGRELPPPTAPGSLTRPNPFILAG